MASWRITSVVPSGSAIDTSKLIHPKVEAEIAFVTSKPLKGPGCHAADVFAATRVRSAGS